MVVAPVQETQDLSCLVTNSLDMAGP